MPRIWSEMGGNDEARPVAEAPAFRDRVAPPDPETAAGSAAGREKTPAEVVLLVVSSLLSAGLAGAGLFIWFTRLHPPFAMLPWLLALGTVIALAGVAVWLEARRVGARPPAWVVALVLVGSAVAVPLAFSSALDGQGAARVVGTVIAGLLLIALIPIVTGLAVDRDRRREMPWLPAVAVVGGAVLGAVLAVAVAVLEAPDFPAGVMHGHADATWERFHAAGTVEFQSMRRTEDGDPGRRASARGVIDLEEARAQLTQDVGTADVATSTVEWEPDEPWRATGPVERLWRALVGVDQWEEVDGGWQGVVDQRRVTAARIDAMDDLRDRIGARWHMSESTDGSVMTVLIQVDEVGFPTRFVTRELAEGASTEVITTTTFRR